MKTPLWESSPGALAALLQTGQFAQADLHTFTLTGGAGVLRISAADIGVQYPGGPHWLSKGVRIDPSSRQPGHWKRGLDVDTWLTVIMPRIVDAATGALFPDQINGTPWTAAARQGALDDADYQVDRAYFAAWPQPYQSPAAPVGIVTLFAGLVSEVDVNDTSVAITSNDYRVLLGASMPTNLFQSGCRHTLFDSGCGLSPPSNYGVAGLVMASDASRSVVTSTTLPSIPGGQTFALGRLVVTSGLNAGFSRMVTAWNGAGAFTLLNPLPYAVSPGDTFTAYLGCDKQFTTCARFANTPNFGGTPFIPSPETAI